MRRLGYGAIMLPPNDKDRPARGRRKPATTPRAKSPAAKARDARRAAEFAATTGKPARPKKPAKAAAKPSAEKPKGRTKLAPRSKAEGRPAPKPEARPAIRPSPEPRPAPRPRAAAAPAPQFAARPQAPGNGERIAKLLARAGVGSRRDVERMIAEGRVALGGAVVDTPATILKSLYGVTVDGNPVAAAEPTRLFLYHKPTGLLTAARDPKGRPTIYDRLPRDLPRVMPVGRLDLNTEGLLLLTTDGEFKRVLELPRTGVERTYRARAYGQISQAQLEELIEGIEIEGVRYGSIDANLERRTGANVWIEMRLKEGKNREVRRVLEHLGLSVSRLIRTAYGPFVLGDLPPGAVGEVKQHALVAFRKTLKA